MTTLYPEDELLPLSGLQHLLFCERQRMRTPQPPPQISPLSRVRAGIHSSA